METQVRKVGQLFFLENMHKICNMPYKLHFLHARFIPNLLLFFIYRNLRDTVA